MPKRSAFVVLLMLCGVAKAEDGTDDSSIGKAKDEKKKDEKKAKPTEELELSGRVFARSEMASVDSAAWSQELKLDSARVGVSYRWKDKLRVKATAELAGGPEVKDAYVDLDGPSGIDVRAGYFKVPISVIENASGWDLPTVDRGAVAEIIEDGLGLSGRRDGVMVDWEPKSGQVKVGLMLSQSVAVTGLDPSRPLEDGGGVMATARVEAQLCPCLRVGAHVSNRETVVNNLNIYRYWAGGVDAELDLETVGKGLRLWADVIAGEDPFYLFTRADERATFTSGQLVAAWRFGGEKKNALYVEPFAGGGYFNPNVSVKRDEIMDALFGVNAGRWKRWRVQGQFEVVTAKGLRPSGLSGVGDDVNDKLQATIQLGAAF